MLKLGLGLVSVLLNLSGGANVSAQPSQTLWELAELSATELQQCSAQYKLSATELQQCVPVHCYT